jgi:hypothetical protein
VKIILGNFLLGLEEKIQYKLLKAYADRKINHYTYVKRSRALSGVYAYLMVRVDSWKI